MKAFEYIIYFIELKSNIKEAFIKGIRVGMYIGLIIIVLILTILHYIL